MNILHFTTPLPRQKIIPLFAPPREQSSLYLSGDDLTARDLLELLPSCSIFIECNCCANSCGIKYNNGSRRLASYARLLIFIPLSQPKKKNSKLLLTYLSVFGRIAVSESRYDDQQQRLVFDTSHVVFFHAHYLIALREFNITKIINIT